MLLKLFLLIQFLGYFSSIKQCYGMVWRADNESKTKEFTPIVFKKKIKKIKRKVKMPVQEVVSLSNATNEERSGRFIKSKTLTTVADTFLSLHCFIDKCKRSAKRAEFCCYRNFNQGCCDYFGQPPQAVPSYRPSYNAMSGWNNNWNNNWNSNWNSNNNWNGWNSNWNSGWNSNYNNNWNYNWNNNWNNYDSNYGHSSWSDYDEHPGRCPRANQKSIYPNIVWHKKFEVNMNIHNRLRDEGYFLDPEDRSFEKASEKYDVTYSPKTKADEKPEARLFFKPFLKRPNFHVVSSCQSDNDCPWNRKCCYYQVTQFVYRKGCQSPISYSWRK